MTVKYKFSKERKRKMSERMKGRKITWGAKITKAKLGFKYSEESKRKMRDSHLGQVAWNKGLKGYLKGRKITWADKISLGKKNSLKSKLASQRAGKIMGDRNGEGKKHPAWKGGKSFELYGFKWTDLLKHSIRIRDCFACKICEKNGWVVHHIDYDKKNCNPENLITLCHSCHGKTNFNRDYWIKYFKNG